MQADTAGYRVLREEQRNDAGSGPQTQMTPARRAALDALEREFHDLLKAANASQAA